MENDVFTITLLCLDEASCLETVALRGVLEYFGYTVSVYWIGNKQDFLNVLHGKTETSDVIVIAGHGTEGAFFLPASEQILFGDLQVRLPGKTIVSLGCETSGAADAFKRGLCATYIAPAGSPEGNDALFFAVQFFWHLAQHKNIDAAFEIANAVMPDGSTFRRW